MSYRPNTKGPLVQSDASGECPRLYLASRWLYRQGYRSRSLSAARMYIDAASILSSVESVGREGVLERNLSTLRFRETKIICLKQFRFVPKFWSGEAAGAREERGEEIREEKITN